MNTSRNSSPRYVMAQVAYLRVCRVPGETLACECAEYLEKLFSKVRDGTGGMPASVLSTWRNSSPRYVMALVACLRVFRVPGETLLQGTRWHRWHACECAEYLEKFFSKVRDGTGGMPTSVPSTLRNSSPRYVMAQVTCLRVCRGPGETLHQSR